MHKARGFPGGSDGEESACNAGDLGLIPGSGRSPGEGNGNPLQFSCLDNSRDRGAWQAIVHGVTKSRTRLSDFHTHTHAQVEKDTVETSFVEFGNFSTAKHNDLIFCVLS